MGSYYQDYMRLNGHGLKGKRMKRWFRGMWSNPQPNTIEYRYCLRLQRRYKTNKFRQTVFDKTIHNARRIIAWKNEILPF